MKEKKTDENANKSYTAHSVDGKMFTELNDCSLGL